MRAAIRHRESQEQTMQGRVSRSSRTRSRRAASALRRDRRRAARAGTSALRADAADGSLRGPFDAFLPPPRSGAALAGARRRHPLSQQLSPTARARSRSCSSPRTGTARSSASRTKRSRARSGSRDDELAAIRATDVSTASPVTRPRGRPHRVALLDGDLDDDAVARGIRGARRRRSCSSSRRSSGYYSTLALQLRVFRVIGGT